MAAPEEFTGTQQGVSPDAGMAPDATLPGGVPTPADGPEAAQGMAEGAPQPDTQQAPEDVAQRYEQQINELRSSYDRRYAEAMAQLEAERAEKMALQRQLYEAQVQAYAAQIDDPDEREAYIQEQQSRWAAWEQQQVVQQQQQAMMMAQQMAAVQQAEMARMAAIELAKAKYGLTDEEIEQYGKDPDSFQRLIMRKEVEREIAAQMGQRLDQYTQGVQAQAERMARRVSGASRMNLSGGGATGAKPLSAMTWAERQEFYKQARKAGLKKPPPV